MIIDLPNADTMVLIYANALRLLVDQQLGYPKQSTVYDTTGQGWTWTCSHLVMHPTQVGRWSLPVTDEMVPWVSSLLGTYRQKVTDGTANDNEKALAALPDPVAADASWAG